MSAGIIFHPTFPRVSLLYVVLVCAKGFEFCQSDVDKNVIKMSRKHQKTFSVCKSLILPHSLAKSLFRIFFQIYCEESSLRNAVKTFLVFTFIWLDVFEQASKERSFCLLPLSSKHFEARR